MIEAVDQVSEIEDKILKTIRKQSFSGNASKRLLSERKLAEIYSAPRTRVREAIKRLISKRYLYTKPGAGTYINTESPQTAVLESMDNMLSFPHMGEIETSKIKIKNFPKEVTWEKAIQLFNDKYPFIEIVTETDLQSSDDVAFDIIFNKTYELNINHEKFSEISTGAGCKSMLNEDEFCPRLFRSCEVNGKLLGIPLLRTTSSLYSNRRLLEEYGITESQLRECDDIFKIGHMVEQESGNEIMGARYLGFIYHAALEGLVMEYKGGRIEFDDKKAVHLLERLKQQFKSYQDINSDPKAKLSAFVNGKCLFYPDFLAIYPELKKSNSDIILMNLPHKQEGFFCEWMYLGSIPKDAANREDALLLLTFLADAEAQQVLVERNPYWLSVRLDVLGNQKGTLPLPDKAFDFDIRSYYSQLDVALWKSGPKINMELTKYFMGILSLDEAIERMKSCCCPDNVPK